MAPLFNAPLRPSDKRPPEAAKSSYDSKRVSSSGSFQGGPAKRQKRDPAMESMPLAAKGSTEVILMCMVILVRLNVKKQTRSVRPSSLAEFVGQEELLGENGVLRTLMNSDRIPSMVLW